MYIKFTEVSGSNFQSLSNVNIKLNDQGIIKIEGINEYESNASSNGSGKSSCLEMIIWTIYGKTSSGISDPSNRHLGNSCHVKLSFYINNQEYTIIRSIKDKKYGTSLQLFRDNKDITSKNKTDTSKIIENDILPFSKDIFMSTIFLSQGFSNKISSLTPSAKKERIESLTETSSKIAEFKEKLTTLNNNYKSKSSEVNNKIAYSKGIKDSYQNQISDIKNKQSSMSSKDIKKYNRDEINSNIDNLKSSILEINSTIDIVDKKISNLDEIINKQKAKININTTEIASLSHIIQDITNDSKDKKCPTCGQIMSYGNKEDMSDIINTHKENIKLYKSIIAKTNTNLESNMSKIKNLHDTKNSLMKDMNSKRLQINTYNNNLANIELLQNLPDYSKEINELESKISNINKEILENTEEVSNYNLSIDVIEDSIKLVTKQFRSYLLESTIIFMNTRLQEYSNILFSNSHDVIKMMLNGNNLDIYLGESLYDTLSGGEKRKIDIALVLAQRDLALNISGISCNLLVLDEIFDNLDNTSIKYVLDLIDNVSSDIESMYIISHKSDLNIPYDNTLIVTKGSNQVSTVSYK